MRKTVIAIFAAVSALACAAEVDGIVAVVGTKPILRSDVAEAMRRADVQDDSRFDEFRMKLVDRALMLLAAENSKMTMQEWLVDNRVSEIVRDNFAGDRNRLVETLARQKTSFAEWRRRLKEEMVVSAMRWHVVYSNAKASPSAMRKEFESHPERYVAGRKASVSVILLRPGDDEAKNAVDAALAAEGFEETAKKFSVDSHAKDGGLWKDIDPAEAFRPEIAQAIAALKEGETSGWVEVDGWRFLVRKNSDSGTRPMTFAEAYADVERNVVEAEASRLQKEWIDRLREQYYIKIY